MRKKFLDWMGNVAGNVSIMLALGAVPLMGAAGAGLDMVRWTDAQSNLVAAMDAGVLAGTEYLAENPKDLSGAIAQADKFFDQSLTASLFAVEDVSFKLNAKGNGLAAFGNAEIDTSLLRVLGINRLTILSPNVSEAAVAEAGSVAPSSDLEISLMLDVTGSMCNDDNGPCTSGTKITALKDAASQLVDTVVWQDQSKFTSKVAVVPFSTRVRVAPDASGSSIMKKLTDLQPTWTGWYNVCTAGTGGGGSESSGAWTCTKYQPQIVNNWKLMPCVSDRFYNAGWKFDLTDDEPGSDSWLNAHDGSRMPEGPDSSSANATSKTGNSSGDLAEHWNYSPDGKCADVAEANEVLPLTNDKAALKSKINGLEAYGATGGVLGTAFSWYMLSPEWKNVWTGLSQPKSYDLLTETNEQGLPKLRKIAILMTDGVYNTYRSWKDQDINMLSTNARQMCKNMKAKGIEIFTVGFQLDSLSAAQKSVATAMLQECATSADHFYNSADPTALKTAFADIAKDVVQTATRLTK
jgi:Putative Flp pilus-assembly TadE/G-like/von Willebrand factor type A domain